jgi:oligoendopeptidase F
MNMRWNLDALYTSFEGEEFISDLQKYDELIANFNFWANSKLNNLENTTQKIEDYLIKRGELANLFDRLMGYASLTAAVNATNQKALGYVEKLEDKLTNLTEADISFKKWIGKINNLDIVINSSPMIRPMSFILRK